MAKSDLFAGVVPVADEEKTSHAVVSSTPGSGTGSESETGWSQTWTEDEEKAVVRKVDRIVMPILMLVFFGLQLDRSNAYVPITTY